MWRNRIDAGVKYLEEQLKDGEEATQAYLGDILPPEKSDFKDHRYEVNMQHIDVRSSTPKLYSQSPYVYIDAEDAESDAFAEVMEKIINKSLDKRWFLNERMDSGVKGTKLQGRIYFKTSYKFSKDKIGREFCGEEPNDEIIVSYVSRGELILPRECKNFESARWVIHRIKEKIGAIREKYKLKDDDKPTVCEEEKDLPPGMTTDEKEDFQYGYFFEIEDRENHELSIIVDGVDRFAEKPYEMPYGFYSMFDKIEWNHIPGEQDTKPDYHFWKRQLIALCETKTQQHNHNRKLNAKYKWRSPDGKGPTPTQQHQLESYEDGIFVNLKAGEDFEPVQHAPLGQEVYLGENSTRQDITTISGMNEMKQGLPQVEKTAREAMAIVREAQDVVSYKAYQVERCLASILNKCIWLIQNFYDTTRVVKLTGMEKAEYLGFQDKIKRVGAKAGLALGGSEENPYLSFVGKNIAGKFSVRVEPGSTMPVNEAMRKQELQEFIGLIMKAPQIMAATNPQELLKEIAKVLHLENKGIILDAKSPEQENELLKRDVPLVPELNEDHVAHLASHERENNKSSSFISHILTHKLMQGFLAKAQVGQGPPIQVGKDPMALSQNIPGMPQGSAVPPGALPQVPGASPAPQPPTGGVPPVIQ